MKPKNGKSGSNHPSRGSASVLPLPVDRTPAVRDQRIRAARARIAAGFYDRDEVQERLVDAVLDDLLDE
jgi:hypothetical protein